MSNLGPFLQGFGFALLLLGVLGNLFGYDVVLESELRELRALKEPKQ